MVELCQMEREELIAKLNDVEKHIIKTLTPRDVADDRGVVLEVRAGTGL